MSLRRHLLNRYLRWTEKPLLSRGSPQLLRRVLELQARLFFRGPRDVRAVWRTLPKGPRALWLVPSNAGARVILYIHGGGFVFGSPQTHQAMLARLASRSAARAVLPTYARVPEARFPEALEDVRAAWEALRDSGIAAQNIVIGGDSAGGALAFNLLAELCQEGGALPAGVFGLSPLLDMTFSGASFRENAGRDVLLPTERASEMAQLYLNGRDARDPRASPLFADFSTAPPIWLCVSDSEILRDDSRRLAARLKATEVSVTLREEHDLPHVWPLFQNHLPEAQETLTALAAWIRTLPLAPDDRRDRAGGN
ncbi:alpha/beta hydrolase [Sulfitobacter sp. PS-8MA]|uniref:alpha/beta hydrolase n=1 Tax=Sulfitobacter sp. PS-8MA TaxID=3237707 RepID=UPI0034C6CEA4